MKAKGLFISFEGIDGCGKSTQIAMLHAKLIATGHKVFYTKEPGDINVGSNIGHGVRQLLFSNPTTKQMHPGVADLLFLADHLQTAGDIEQAINRGDIVICDRYADSQFGYAASLGKKAPDWALEYYRDRFCIVPDLTLFFVVRGPETRMHEDIGWALKRAKDRRGIEAGKQSGKAWGDDVGEQERIQARYKQHFASFHPERVTEVQVWEFLTPEQLFREISLEVNVFLEQHGKEGIWHAQPVEGSAG